MDRATIESAVKAAAAETYGMKPEDITLETTWEALGNHSSKLLRFSMFIDGELDVEDIVDLDELMENETIADTVELIAGKLA
ncbi:MAG: acyl carrier protein [Coriobacteriaceae bacterium]|nr:acyl carrier protein [Coriobacteriaceae bacterium]